MDIVMPNFEESLPPMVEEIKVPTHYKLDDGRFWVIKEAKFVNSISENDFAIDCAGQEGINDIKSLIECLDQYHYPKGELKTDDEYASEAREKRNILLTESDYLAMPDYPLDEYKKSAILSYRQLLRDISKQSGFPRNIIWPEKPEI